MRNFSWIVRRCLCGLAALAAVPLLTLAAQAQNVPRERQSLNAGWRFQKEDPADAVGKLDYATLQPWILPSGNEFTAAPAARPDGNPGGDVSYVQGAFDDSGWRQLNLPHDWGIEGPFNQNFPGETGKLPWWGVGWYRKHLTVPAADAGKRFFLDIDGAMSYATVWLNGQLIGGWPYGYASFRLDLTPYVKPGGNNTLAIRLDNPRDSSRWYPGGGIYRNVWLEKTSPVHVDHWGTYVTTPQVSVSAATVAIQTTVRNDSSRPVTAQLTSTILDAANKSVASLTQAVGQIPAGQNQVVHQNMTFNTPKLWSLKTPYLYHVVSRVTQGRTVADRYDTPFGVRTLKFDPNAGFFLNGQHVKINGVCDHHDLGALGAAINTRALERQIQILQEMGCNAIRTSHNPPAPELLALCDRLGMLVMDEFSDTWSQPKKPNGYAKLFADWHDKDMRSLVRRDRNHPCVILWSVGNEIPEQGSARGTAEATELVGDAHAEDPSRPVTSAVSDTNAGYNGYQKNFDVFGFNYRPYEYTRFHAANPDQAFFGSETSSTISSRGEYFFPVSSNKNDGKSDYQMSSYDLYAPGWATLVESEFKGQDQNPSVAGEFVWTGFDYLGEPTPYAYGPAPSRSSYFGIVDLAGFKKDRFYLYQAHWRPDFPMAHILPHWNWPDRIGQVTPVHVYTSGDEAELFLNGTSLGRKKKGQYEYRLRWDDVVYQPGELRVVAYKNGQRWAEDVVKTTGPAAKTLLTADRSTIKADGLDLSYVTVTVADKDSLRVPRSKNPLQFEVSGPGEIVATDNGDATNQVPFQSHERAAYNGLALVIVRAQPGKTGTITVRARSEGLQGTEIALRSMP